MLDCLYSPVTNAMYIHQYDCMYSPFTKTMTFLPASLEQFPRTIHSAVSQAAVLILTPIKLNSQFHVVHFSSQNTWVALEFTIWEININSVIDPIMCILFLQKTVKITLRMILWQPRQKELKKKQIKDQYELTFRNYQIHKAKLSME